MSTITWLHLSDLHSLSPNTSWDRKEILRTILDDLSEMEEKHGLLPDFIFFTGDIAFGQISENPISQQFEQAGVFLEKIRCAFTREIPKRNIFIVPGNHDINRDNVTIDQVNWLDKEATPDTILKLISSPNIQWQRYIERLNEYAEFLNLWGYSHLLTDRDRMVYHSIRELRGTTIGIVGLNSAWSCSSDGEKGKLWFGGQWQIKELSSLIEDTQVKIALMHHPPNWFVEHDDSISQRLIERNFNFFLHGHEHTGWVDDKKSNYIKISSAACYSKPNSENGYNLVKLDLANQKCKIYLRKFDEDGGGWVARPIAKSAPVGIWTVNELSILRNDLNEEKDTGQKKRKIFNKYIPSENGLDDKAATSIPTRIHEKLKEYRVIEELGRGSFGVVYLVANRKTNILYALKLFTPDAFEKEERNEAYLRFRRGIEIMRRLGHPGVLQIFNIVDEGPDKCYYLMYYCEQGNLKKYCENNVDLLALSGIKEKIDLIISLCNIVAYAHQKQIIHRDIKPNNILLDWDHESNRIFPKLSDFDLAFQKGNTGLTYGNLGSIFFLPPELHRDLSQQCASTLSSSLPSLKQRAESIDIYGTAGILYYFITLCYPPLGRDEVVVTEINRVISSLKDGRDKEIVKALGYIIYISLNSDISQRPKTIIQLKELIEVSLAHPEKFQNDYEKLFENKPKNSIVEKGKVSDANHLSGYAVDIMMNTLRSGVIIIEEGLIRYLNRAARKLIDKEQHQILGKPIDSFFKGIGEDDKYRNITDFLYYLERSHKRVNIKLHNGEIIICDATAINFSYKNKEYYLVLMDDRTEIAKIEAGLQASQKMEAVGTLAGGIAHDFNNILAEVYGYAELWQIKNDENKTDENIKGVLKAASRGEELVRQLLAFTRRTKEPEPKPVRIASIIKETLQIIQGKFPDNIRIIENIAKQESLVLAVPDQLSQVLMNLLINAGQAIGKEGGSISVTLENVGSEVELSGEGLDFQNESYIKISVEDDGCGIEEDIIGKIFEPFFTTREPNKGTGLGLAACYGIVNNLGGRIFAESQPGIGSIFNVILPEYLTMEIEEATEKETKINAEAKGERIIYIDDKELVKIHTETLKAIGYNVTGYSDPVEAFKSFSDAPNEFDLLIANMILPDMDGYELSLKIRSLRSDIPIILCNSHTEKIDDEKLESMSKMYFIMKPILVKEFKEIISRALNVA